MNDSKLIYADTNRFDLVLDEGGENDQLRLMVFSMDPVEIAKSIKFEAVKIDKDGIFFGLHLFPAPGFLQDILTIGALPETCVFVKVDEKGNQEYNKSYPLSRL